MSFSPTSARRRLPESPPDKEEEIVIYTQVLPTGKVVEVICGFINSKAEYLQLVSFDRIPSPQPSRAKYYRENECYHGDICDGLEELLRGHMNDINLTKFIGRFLTNATKDL